MHQHSTAEQGEQGVWRRRRRRHWCSGAHQTHWAKVRQDLTAFGVQTRDTLALLTAQALAAGSAVPASVAACVSIVAESCRLLIVRSLKARASRSGGALMGLCSGVKVYCPVAVQCILGLDWAAQGAVLANARRSSVQLLARLGVGTKTRTSDDANRELCRDQRPPVLLVTLRCTARVNLVAENDIYAVS